MLTIITVEAALAGAIPVGAIWCAVSSTAQAKDDKISIPMQKKLGTKWMDENHLGYAVILEIPGHSRSETLIEEALQEYRDDGVTAYDDLKKLWKAGLLSVLWAFAHNRLGRANVQHSYVIENTIRFGGAIYLHHGGFIEKSNHRGQIALGGFESATYGDMMRDRWTAAQPKVLESGLPMNAPLWTHRVVYDDRGNRVRLEVNEAKKPLINAMIELLLDATPWHEMGIALQQRYGFTRPNGQPIVHAQIHQMFYNPAFWGHTGKNYHNLRRENKMRVGPWVYDETAPLPPDVVLYRNTIPPCVEGELAERVKAELRRRNALRGKGGPRTAHQFNTLAVCAVCGRKMVYTATHAKSHIIEYYACRLRPQDLTANIPRCSNTMYARMEHLIETVQAYMLACVEDDIFQPRSNTPSTSAIADHERAIEDIERQLMNLIEHQSVNPAVVDLYQKRIDSLAETRAKQRELLNAARAAYAESLSQAKQRDMVIGELRSLDFEEFWSRPPHKINQFLLRLFGDWRLIIKDGRVQGIN